MAGTRGASGGGNSGRMQYRCSFCGKGQDEVKRLIAGPGAVYICDECVELCREIIEEEETPTPKVQPSFAGIPTPKRIHEQLSQYVIGQDTAKKNLSVAVYKEKHLGDEDIRHLAVDRRADEDDAVPQQPGVDVPRSLAPVRALDNRRDDVLDVVLAVHNGVPSIGCDGFARPPLRLLRRLLGRGCRVTRGRCSIGLHCTSICHRCVLGGGLRTGYPYRS